jgi:predicted transport protein
MADLEQAVATQLSNIEKRTGKSIEELSTLVRESGLSKHGELVALLKSTLGMGHGDANLLVHVVRKAGQPDAASEQERSLDQVLDELYSGPKAALRPIHERLQEELEGWGEFEWVPKKTYISYRRKKQFATIGPATKTRVEVGLNMKGVAATERLEALPAGHMCNYKVRLTEVEQVDAELLGWVRTAYEAAE